MKTRPVELTRLANFRAIAAQNGGISAMARRLGKAQDQWQNTIGKTPTKNIGPEIAREVEVAYGLPEGWSDTPWDLLPEEMQSGPLRVPGVADDSEDAPITIERSILSLQYICGALVNALAASDSGQEIAEGVREVLKSSMIPARMRTKGPIGYILAGLDHAAEAGAVQERSGPSQKPGESLKGSKRTAPSKR